MWFCEVKIFPWGLRSNARGGTWGPALQCENKNRGREWHVGRKSLPRAGAEGSVLCLGCQDVPRDATCPHPSPPTKPRRLLLRLITTQWLLLNYTPDKNGTGEMALGLRTCTMTSEDPSLVPSNQARASVYIIQNNFKNESFKKKIQAHTRTHPCNRGREQRQKKKRAAANLGVPGRPGLHSRTWSQKEVIEILDIQCMDGQVDL